MSTKIQRWKFVLDLCNISYSLSSGGPGSSVGIATD